MKCCFYIVIFVTGAFIFLSCLRICIGSYALGSKEKPVGKSGLSPKEYPSELKSSDMFARSRLTLTDENGEPLEEHNNHELFKDGIKTVPKSNYVENESNLYRLKLKEPHLRKDKENHEPILKSLQKSHCQRQPLREFGINKNCDNKLSSNDDSEEYFSTNSGPTGEDIVDGKVLQIKSKSTIPNSSEDAEVIDTTEEDEIDLQIQKEFHEDEELPKVEKLKLPDCSGVHDKRPVLVISTLDGLISGIDYETGDILWSHQTGNPSNPLLSSSISNIEIASRGDWVRLIPSLNGGIYRFDGESVEALPVNADTLLYSSFKFNEDTMFTGNKFVEVIGVSPITGEIVYICNGSGCPKTSTSPYSEVLVIKRVSQTVRAIDPKTGSERWNFSVGQHEVNIVDNGCEMNYGNTLEPDLSFLPSLKFVLPEGIITASNTLLNVQWKQKLSSPIVSAWRFMGGELVTIDLFSGDSVPALIPEEHNKEDLLSKLKEPSLYVGIHHKQLYIQENKRFYKDVTGAVQQFAIGGAVNNGVMKFPKVLWQPYLATALARTPALDYQENTGAKHPMLLDYDKKEDSSALIVKHPVEHIYDNGYFLYGDDDILLNDSNSWDDSGNEEDYSTPFEDDFITNRIYHICFQYGPHTWWKILLAFLGFSLCHVMFVQYLISRVVRNIRRNIQERALRFILLTLERTQMRDVINRLGITIPQLPPPVAPTLDTQPTGTSFHSSSQHSAQRQDSIFFSRYASDFEPLSCLGKGGFGVVFQVKNKLDQNEYAIKRIVLPSKESSAERVKREVRALAKLNHSNIVRYYNSWLETPPPGWKEESDFWWRKGDVASSTFYSPDVDATEDKKELRDLRKVKECNDGSLSGVVDKLGSPGKDINIPAITTTRHDDFSISVWNKSSSDNADPQENSVVNFFKNNESSSDESDNDSVTGYETDDDEDNEDDSSFIIFQDSSVNNNDSKNKVVNNESLSLENNESLVTQSTPLKKRSQSLYLKSPNKTKVLKRRRVKSHGPQTQLERPNSLCLQSTNYSDPGLTQNSDNKRIKDDLVMKKNDLTPNPRTYLYIQMELCHRESLKDWLFTNKERDYEKIKFIFNDIVQAVEYVHDRALMHRDLKPSNIFFSLDGEIKVGDFGLVTTIEDEENALTPLDSLTSKNQDMKQFLATAKQRTVNAGTHLYMSPEQLSGKMYTYKIDIFSVGLIFFEMLVPFSTEMERREVLRDAREMKFPSGFQLKFPNEASLLELALHPNPSERPTTRGIRARQPLVQLQKDLDQISPEEHFNLPKLSKGHGRSNSGSFIMMHSTSFSST